MKLGLVHMSDSQLKNWPFGGLNPDTGLNRRFEDALKCFDFVVDHAIKNKIPYFIHAGDVNEERNPDSLAIEEFAKRVKRLTDNGIKVIITVGNHDIDSALGTTSSVSYLKALGLKNVYIADKEVEVFAFDDVRFLCLPYFTKAALKVSSNEEIVEYLKEQIEDFIMTDPEVYVYNVCVAHYSTDKVFEGIEINEPIVPVRSFKAFDYVALGHIHSYKMYFDEDVQGGYCGSPYKVTFGENEDKFFNVVNFDEGDIDKIKIPNRDFIDIEVDATEADQSGIDHFVLHKLKKMDLDGKFLKITIKCYQNFNPKPIYDYLKSKEIFHYMPIKFEKVKVKEEARLEYKPGMTSEQIVKRFLDKQEMKKAFKTEVLNEAREIIKEANI